MKQQLENSLYKTAGTGRGLHRTLFFIAALGASPLAAQAAGGSGRALGGFAETPWMTTFSEVRNKFKNLATSQTAAERVEIVALEPNEYILVRRNGILYRYSFYKTAYNVARLANHELTEEEYGAEEALLFHVKITPQFLDAKALNEKIETAYGPKTRSTVDPKTQRGVDIWELNGGFIFQWYEPYKRHGYTRTIDFVSFDMAKRIIQEYGDYFDSAEKEILKNLIIQ